MSEVEEGPPVCFACEFEQRGFPCRDGQGAYQENAVALALRDCYRLAGEGDHEPLAWAVECVDELILESPQMALNFILLALPIFETDEDLAVLAAGPLEDLLGCHGAAVIDRVEVEAAGNDRFRLLLSGVRGRNDVGGEIWRRLQRTLGSGPWLDRDPRTPQDSDEEPEA
ncbi:MAG: DUF6869 domain-containing protein [Kiloniellaceae bacterium]